jgi:hypothetical protein
VTEDKKPPKKLGPKGGVKHPPGRGHVSKSAPRKKKRFRKKTARKRQKTQNDLRQQWDD